MQGATLSPREATDEASRLKLTEDNFPRKIGSWSILLNDGHVSLHAPEGGSWIEVPKDQFDAIVDWYNRPQAAA